MTLRPLALLFMAGVLFSCGSKDATPTSGGAAFQLQAADSAAAKLEMLSSSCPDPGVPYVIAIKGDDGKNKLIVDGADDARVRCQIDDTHFDISVSNRNASLNVAGHYKGTDSADAKVTIVTPSTTYVTTSSEICTVKFTKYSNGTVVDTDGKIYADFNCKVIKASRTTDACGVAGNVTSPAYFQFSNCSGF